MTRTVHHGVVVLLIAVIVTSAYSQVQRPRVRATRRNSGSQSFGMSSRTGPMDPNMTPQERLAQQQREFQQRMAEMQRQMKEMQRQAEESRSNAIRQMLNATDEQWTRIKPKLDLIDRFKAEANVSAEPGLAAGMSGFQSGGIGFGGGFMGGMWGGTMDASGRPHTWSQSWGSPSTHRSAANPTDGEVLCEQLLRDLQAPGTPPADIAQRVAALRRIRTRAQEQLAQARKDLRSVIVPAQEPALVVMGYLD